MIIQWLNERLHVMRLNSGCMPVPCSYPTPDSLALHITTMSLSLPLRSPSLLFVLPVFRADLDRLTEQVPWDMVKKRDAKFGVDTAHKKEIRKDIAATEPDELADQCWKK